MGKATKRRETAQRVASQSVTIDRVSLALACAGLILTALLIWSAARTAALPFCDAGSGCDVVQNSAWARLFGVPLPWWGFAAFALLGLGALKRASRRPLVIAVATMGFAISIYLMAVSWWVIEATCAYCVASALLWLAAFVATWRAPARLHASRPRWYGLVAGVACATLMHVQAIGGLRSSPVDPYLDGLARHLDETGARFYGAYWCGHCQAQKGLFGVAASSLPYVECSPNGPKAPRSTTCEMLEIKAYPTWIIDGRRIERVLDPAALASLTGYAAPGPTAQTGRALANP
jgi:uncharacterized membrane protein